MTAHFFTVDVEEYFHVSAFESVIPRDEWQQRPGRLDISLPRILDLLDRHEARGTFFVLGWVAERMPALVRRIVAAKHEVASHGYWHRRIPTLTPGEFRDDLRRSKRVLEDVTGSPVLGFRAPSFSLIPGYEWAFDVLVEEGFRYDSSLFPVRRRGYGYASAPKVPHVIRRASGLLAEFPLATTVVGPLSVPAAGGGYLRHLPFALVRRAFRQASLSGIPATFYVHPWEIDPSQPRVPVSYLTRFRHYRGLAKTLPRMERLLADFRFVDIASAVDRVLRGDAPRYQTAS